MWRTYAQAVTTACDAMNAIPSDDLKKFLYRDYPYLNPQLDYINTTEYILYVVCRWRCSIVNVNLLEDVACYFKIEKAITIIEEYKHHLQFKPLRMILDLKLYAGSPFECEKVTCILDIHVDNCTLDFVQHLQRHALQSHIMIEVIRESPALTIICSVPVSLNQSRNNESQEGKKFLNVNYNLFHRKSSK